MTSEADQIKRKHLFTLGRLLITPNAQSNLTNDDVLQALKRHLDGDWGDLDKHDKHANDCALVEGSRLLSAYQSSNHVKFWIITEADRSATTVLLPEDY